MRNHAFGTRRSQGRWISWALALALLAIVGPTPAPAGAAPGDEDHIELPRAQAVEPLESPFKRIAAMAAPAVVFIEVKRESDLTRYHNFEGGPFDEMFRRMFPQTPEGEDGDHELVPSWGSGFFIDERGYILTNNHVVSEAEQVRVKISDKEGHDHFYDAKVLGEDPATDVAVIKIEPENGERFPMLYLGDSDEISVGDWAIAVGNPFGTLDGSVTVGVVSAKGRHDLRIMGGSPSYQDFIQTDASINFGNSGGPLLNIRGEVIGMNSAINPSGQGIGFAIPINLARVIAEKLINEGRVVRGYIGIYPQEVSPEIADMRGVKPYQGILVGDVIADGPAARAGLQTGDIITTFAGEDVSDVTKFRILVADQPVEKKVPVRYLRDGRQRDTDLQISERPAEEEIASGTPTRRSWLGLEVDEISGREARDRGLEEGEKALVVVRVESGSPADDGGIRRGDIIRRINDKPVKDVDAYEDMMDKLQDRERAIVFLIERDNVTRYYSVRPGNGGK